MTVLDINDSKARRARAKNSAEVHGAEVRGDLAVRAEAAAVVAARHLWDAHLRALPTFAANYERHVVQRFEEASMFAGGE